MANNIWFTADTHLGHSNIIKYCNRPFGAPEEMEEAIITRFNEVIRPGDRLYHLGDVSWSTYDLNRFFNRLNTKEVHLIFGNHDKEGRTKHSNIRSYAHLRNVQLDNISVFLSHYPMRSWAAKGHGGFQLYGHCHNTLPGIGRQMDVGVDTNNFYPWAWESVKAKLKDIPFFPQE